MVFVGMLPQTTFAADAATCPVANSANAELKAYQAALKKELVEIGKAAG